MVKAVFLDRDGTLIKTRVVDGKPFAINKLSDVEIEFGVVESCKLLIKNGFCLILVTNQPDVSNRLCSQNDVIEINNYLERILGITKSYVCFHSKEQDCCCRKPKPGLILRAASELSLSLSSSAMIGDRASDIESAHNAGLSSSYWIEKGYLEPSPRGNFVKVIDFSEACHELLNHRKGLS